VDDVNVKCEKNGRFGLYPILLNFFVVIYNIQQTAYLGLFTPHILGIQAKWISWGRREK
jgi:hypothetical protein